jgi:hypothetical protein
MGREKGGIDLKVARSGKGRSCQGGSPAKTSSGASVTPVQDTEAFSDIPRTDDHLESSAKRQRHQ